jgi:hypothetical protein
MSCWSYCRVNECTRKRSHTCNHVAHTHTPDTVKCTHAYSTGHAQVYVRVKMQSRSDTVKCSLVYSTGHAQVYVRVQACVRMLHIQSCAQWYAGTDRHRERMASVRMQVCVRMLDIQFHAHLYAVMGRHRARKHSHAQCTRSMHGYTCACRYAFACCSYSHVHSGVRARTGVVRTCPACACKYVCTCWTCLSTDATGASCPGAAAKPDAEVLSWHCFLRRV